MKDDRDQFIILERKNGGVATFGDNGKEKLIGIDKSKSLLPLLLRIFYLLIA